MDHTPLNDVLALLALSVPVVWVLKRIAFSSIPGYLLIGTLVGPYALGWLPESNNIQLFAEIGVVFLLFMIGSEFSLSRLIAMRNTVFGLGSLQVIISTLSGGAVAWITGIEWKSALVVGGCLALSSTAIVAKQLSDQLEMQDQHGQLIIAILLFQDLAVVPLLVIIPILTTGGEQSSLVIPILIALGKGLLSFFIVFQTGRWVLRPYYHLVAATRSTEFFTLATLFVSLAAAWLTHQLGLSLALGAFLAGLMLSETEYKQQIQTDIRPFRDVLMSLFFISIGAQLDVTVVIEEWFWIALLTAGLIIGKGFVIVILTRLFGYAMPVALRTGLALGQAGEFSFAVLVVAISNHLLTLQETQPIIASALLSMLISPILIRYNSTITKKTFQDDCNNENNMPVKQLDQASWSMKNHVIICGFGRIGQNLANILREIKISYIALDLDHSLVREAWEAGENVFYGDSTNREILQKTGLEQSSALIITFDDAHISEHIIHSVRTINNAVPVIVRSKDDRHMDSLHAKGANSVVPESFEASIMLATHLLRHLGISTEKSMAFVEKARLDNYKRLRGYFRGEDILGMDESDARCFHTTTLLPDSFAVGKKVKILALNDLQTSLISVRRGTNRMDMNTLDDSFVFEAGDSIVIEGIQSTITNAEKRLLTG